jgi:hypothetical protein
MQNLMLRSNCFQLEPRNGGRPSSSGGIKTALTRGERQPWFPAKISYCRLNGTYDVEFDDGGNAQGVGSKHIRLPGNTFPGGKIDDKMRVEVQKKRISDKPVWKGQAFGQLLSEDDGLATSVGFNQDGGWARQVARPKTSPSQTLQYVPQPMMQQNVAAKPAPVLSRRGDQRRAPAAYHVGFGLRTRANAAYKPYQVCVLCTTKGTSGCVLCVLGWVGVFVTSLCREVLRVRTMPSVAYGV